MGALINLQEVCLPLNIPDTLSACATCEPVYPVRQPMWRLEIFLIFLYKFPSRKDLCPGMTVQ